MTMMRLLIVCIFIASLLPEISGSIRGAAGESNARRLRDDAPVAEVVPAPTETPTEQPREEEPKDGDSFGTPLDTPGSEINGTDVSPVVPSPESEPPSVPTVFGATPQPVGDVPLAPNSAETNPEETAPSTNLTSSEATTEPSEPSASAPSVATGQPTAMSPSAPSSTVTTPGPAPVSAPSLAGFTPEPVAPVSFDATPEPASPVSFDSTAEPTEGGALPTASGPGIAPTAQTNPTTETPVFVLPTPFPAEAPSLSPLEMPIMTPTDMSPQSPVDDSFISPTDSFFNPPTDPPQGYVPPNSDYDPVKDDEDNEPNWEQNTETPEELVHDPRVITVVSLVFALMLLFSIVVAHQLLNNPDGCCASICRLTVSCSCCLARAICFPCQQVCGCGQDTKYSAGALNGHDTTFNAADLELT